MDLEEFIEYKKEEMENNFEEIFESWESFVKVGIALFVGILMIKPSFQLSIFTGIIFIATLVWLFLFKAYLFIENPYYIVIVFGILAIRWAIGDVAGQGFLFLKKGDILSALIFIVVWIILYLRTRQIQEH
jgi:hypothetical protein